MYVGYLDGIAERSFYDVQDADTWCRLYDGHKAPSYKLVCDYCYRVIKNSRIQRDGMHFVIKDTTVQRDGMHFCNQECQGLMLESLKWENHCEVKVTFHKGTISIDRPDEDRSLDSLFCDYDGETIADDISAALDDHGFTDRVDLLKSERSAMDDSAFASNEHVLAATVAVALIRLRKDLEGHDETGRFSKSRALIVNSIMAMAIDMFKKDLASNPEEYAARLDGNAKTLAQRAVSNIDSLVKHIKE